MIWLPPDLQNHEERQQRFVHALRNGEYVQEGADLLETSLDELKTSILAKLQNGKTKGKHVAKPENLNRIYLICDEADLKAVAPLAKYLHEQNYEVGIACL